MSIAIPTFESIRKDYTAEQILIHFGIAIGSDRKAICPFHYKDTDPSLYVNDNSVHCYGCGIHLDVFSLARKLLEKKTGKTPAIPQVFSWFMATSFTDPTLKPESGRSNYIGPVPMDWVEYWQEFLTEEHYTQLLEERLLEQETVDKFKLGWRPVWEAWTLPFMLEGKAEYVQFRHTRPDSKTKYTGLKGYSRGSVMNADILKYPLPYVVVFFGSFDSILADQDGLYAVGTNGSNPFKKEDEARIKDLFKHQRNIFIVPDNTPQEIKPAYKLAELLNAEVRFFPTELPLHTDYIDYRKMGFTSEDFLRDVLGIIPFVGAPSYLVNNVIELALHGDPQELILAHMQMLGKGVVVADLAREIADFERPDTIAEDHWSTIRKHLWKVQELGGFMETLSQITEAVHISSGGW